MNLYRSMGLGLVLASLMSTGGGRQGVLATTLLASPSFEVDPAYTTVPLSELAQLPMPEEVVTDDTLLFSQSPTYALRLFTQDGTPRLNLFNKTEGRTELAGASVIPQATSQGITYSYQGTGIEPTVQVQVDTSGDQTIRVDGNAVAGDRFTGNVTYRPRIALPPNAVIEVTLEDVSRADAPAIALASQTLILGERQVPVPFELMYDPDQIDPRFTYALRARITVDGELRFINTTHVPVITRDNPITDVDVIVDPI